MRRSVLITGASRGLGRALTVAFARRSFVVFAVVRSRRAADDLTAAAFPMVYPVVGDVTAHDLPGVLETTIRANTKSLDLLINNAGSGGSLWSIEQEPEEEVSQLFQTHCVGALRCTRAVLPFLKLGHDPLVVNVTSRLGSIRRAAAGEFANAQVSYSYRIAKAAQNMLTLCLHQELHEHGITVCAIHPGRLLTDSGSSDADITAEEGAQRLMKWVLAANRSTAGSYVELDDETGGW
jgi:NAD(P)-dependent dehydrogenase (short-subunit alcohol dehydrogenase family)